MVGDVVVDGEREVILRLLFVHILVDRDDMARSGVLGTETEAAGIDRNVGELRTLEGSDYVEIERLAERTGLLGTVKDGDLLDGVRRR